MRIQKLYLVLFFSSFYMGVTSQTVLKIPFIQPAAFTVSPSSVYTTYPVGGSVKLGLDASVSGGSGAYSYQWTLSDVILGTESTLTVDQIGNYTLLIKDGKGCQSSIMYYVSENTALSETSEVAMIVYPNPSQGTVYIQMKTVDGLEKITIYTPDGKTVAVYSGKTIKYENNRISLDLKNMPKGKYFISILLGKETFTKAILLR